MKQSLPIIHFCVISIKTRPYAQVFEASTTPVHCIFSGQGSQEGLHVL